MLWPPFNLSIQYKYVLVLTLFTLPPHPGFLTLLTLFPSLSMPFPRLLLSPPVHSGSAIVFWHLLWFVCFWSIWSTVHHIWSLIFRLSTGLQGNIFITNSRTKGTSRPVFASESITVGGSQDAICGTILYIKNWVGVTLLCCWPLSIFDGEEQQLVNNGGRKWLRWKVKDRARLQRRNRKALVRHEPTFDRLDFEMM